jgi:nucleoside 2-deoxyribosyltransferase
MRSAPSCVSKAAGQFVRSQAGREVVALVDLAATEGAISGEGLDLMSDEGIHEHERGQICPLGGETLTVHYHAPVAGGVYDVDCPICGHYQITSALEDRLASGATRPDFGPILPYLRAHVRQETDRGETTLLTLENHEELARARMATPNESKRRKLLELIAANSRPGQFAKLDGAIALRIDAHSAEEVAFWLKGLCTGGLVEIRPTIDSARRKTGGEYRVSVNGFEALSPLSAQGRRGVAFVAMSFDKARNDAFAAIKAAVEEDCGLTAVRIDRVHHNEQITDKILAGIRSAQFTIADVTGQRAGIYFEGGFAMALGRPVIWCCENSDLKNVHFDTRQFSHVVYENPSDLREKLRDRIRATILSPMRLA